MCELQNNCGFYIYLRSTNRIPAELNCPKVEPRECPRYKVRVGKINNVIAKKIYNVDGDVYKHELPISHEEARM